MGESRFLPPRLLETPRCPRTPYSHKYVYIYNYIYIYIYVYILDRTCCFQQQQVRTHKISTHEGERTNHDLVQEFCRGICQGILQNHLSGILSAGLRLCMICVGRSAPLQEFCRQNSCWPEPRFCHPSNVLLQEFCRQECAFCRNSAGRKKENGY